MRLTKGDPSTITPLLSGHLSYRLLRYH